MKNKEKGEFSYRERSEIRQGLNLLSALESVHLKRDDCIQGRSPIPNHCLRPGHSFFENLHTFRTNVQTL